MTKNLIFDIDGTLWDSTEAVADAFTQVVLSEPLVAHHAPLTAEILKREFGKPLYDIGYSLFPEIPKEESNRIIDRMCDNEVAYITENVIPAFDNVEDTLRRLAVDHDLYIISNCQAGYAECFIDTHHLGDIIKDHLCPGDTNLLKADNIKLMMKKHHMREAAYIGDTKGDYIASKEAGVTFIHAAYGFGQVETPDAVINDITDLLTLCR